MWSNYKHSCIHSSVQIACLWRSFWLCSAHIACGACDCECFFPFGLSFHRSQPATFHKCCVVRFSLAMRFATIRRPSHAFIRIISCVNQSAEQHRQQSTVSRTKNEITSAHYRYAHALCLCLRASDYAQHVARVFLFRITHAHTHTHQKTLTQQSTQLERTHADRCVCVCLCVCRYVREIAWIVVIFFRLLMLLLLFVFVCSLFFSVGMLRCRVISHFACVRFQQNVTCVCLNVQSCGFTKLNHHTHHAQDWISNIAAIRIRKSVWQCGLNDCEAGKRYRARRRWWWWWLWRWWTHVHRLYLNTVE